MRPHTSMGFHSPAQELVDPDVKVGEDILGTGFKKHLDNFYLKASPEDRARCLELLTSIELGDAIKDQGQYLPETDPATYQYHTSQPRVQPRPKTAMGFTGKSDPLNPYSTTYKREYTAFPGESAFAERPQTSRIQASHDLSAPIGTTNYQNEYYGKCSMTKPIRTGTASGNRRNNPHPPESFMVWKLRKNTARGDNCHNESYSELTDDVMDRVMRGKLTSTYRQDYLGIPQGVQVKGAFEEIDDWKSRVPFTLDSTKRFSFQKPDLYSKPELKGNTMRYGCNKLKDVAALGVVPTISDRYMDVKTRTTYEREYNSNNGPLVRNVRALGRHLGADALQKHLPGAGYKDTETLNKMIHTLRPHPPTYRPSSRASSYSSRQTVPPTGCVNSAV